MVGLGLCVLPGAGCHASTAQLRGTIAPSEGVANSGPGGRWQWRLEPGLARISAIGNSKENRNPIMSLATNRACGGVYNGMIFLSKAMRFVGGESDCRRAFQKISAIHRRTLPGCRSCDSLIPFDVRLKRFA